MVLDNSNAFCANSQKYLGAALDFKLTFNEHLGSALNKIKKPTGFLHKLQNSIKRKALITISKAFSRPHLDYGEVPHDQAPNKSFYGKLESVQ